MAMSVRIGGALDASKIQGLTEDEFRIAEIIGDETEKERERQKGLIEQPVKGLGLGWNPYSFLNSQNWDEFFVKPSVVSACSRRANTSENNVLDFALAKCEPKNWNAVFWMGIAYRQMENAARMDIEKNILQKSLEKRHAVAMSEKGRSAAEARHNKPGGAREKKAAIRAVWATGKYVSRALCAAEEYRALGFQTQETAKNALRNTPDPYSWPGKKGGRAR